MTISAFWNESWTAAVVNHLWQSTVVIAIAWLLALALRKNHARARYWVWFAASVKFLLPFSLLIEAGEWMRSLMPAAVVERPAITSAINQVAQAFTPAEFFGAASAQAAAHRSSWLLMGFLAIWACGALVVLGRFARGWRSVHRAKCAARPIDLAADVPVLLSPMQIEPGIFGILRPVLLLPEGILQKLAPEQLSAIIAHEMCHVRRRDNLTFAIHMLVEALFWFHPAVWWIGTRLIDERERTCDEAVIAAGGSADVYAEGILNVCKLYVESPLSCIAGVTGADLKQRIVRILTGHAASRLNLSRKILLSIAASTAIAAPLTIGLMYARQGRAQIGAVESKTQPIYFAVASIRQDTSNSGIMTFHALDDGVVITGAPVELLVQQAFGVEGDRILGLPDWTKTDRYDIRAKVDDADVVRWKALTTTRNKVAFRALLASRFNFKAHPDTREHQVYSLIVAKGGPRLHEATPGDTYPNGLKKEDGSPLGPAIIMENGKITIQGGDIAALVKTLSYRGLGYPIEDGTGITGKYDMTVEWTPGDLIDAGDGGVSLFTALEEQLGLKLAPEKRPVQMIIVDQIERPTPN